MNNTFKSIGAVLAGLLTNVVLSVGTDTVLESLEIFPAQGLFVTWMLAVALFYRCIYTVAGGYVTAALAHNRPMRHVTILGWIGVALTAVGVVVGWNLSDHWYPIALAAIAFPATWYGGKIFVNKKAKGQ